MRHLYTIRVGIIQHAIAGFVRIVYDALFFTLRRKKQRSCGAAIRRWADDKSTKSFGIGWKYYVHKLQ